MRCFRSRSRTNVLLIVSHITAGVNSIQKTDALSGIPHLKVHRLYRASVFYPSFSRRFFIVQTFNFENYRSGSI